MKVEELARLMHGAAARQIVDVEGGTAKPWEGLCERTRARYRAVAAAVKKALARPAPAPKPEPEFGDPVG